MQRHTLKQHKKYFYLISDFTKYTIIIDRSFSLISIGVFFVAFGEKGDDVDFGVLGEFDVSFAITENWVVDVRVEECLRMLAG